MADVPSPILLMREMSTGSQVNTWGTYLIISMRTLERASKGYQALPVTGDATISWTNYTASNDGAVAFLKLTGSISSAATLTFPGYQHFVGVWDAAGQAVTIKCAGGTGVTIQNGDRALLYCDGTDYYNAGPSVLSTGLTIAGKLSGMVAGTANTDGVNVLQLSAAVAASVPAGTAGTFLNSITDTTRGFLTDKLVGRGLLKTSTLNAGSNEQDVVETTGYTATGTDTYAITPAPAITAYAAGQAFLVTFTNANTTAPTINVNGLGAKAITKNGATALDRSDIAAGAQRLVTYDGSQFQISGTSVPAPGAGEANYLFNNSPWGF
jgi:hypothetical protein